MRCAAQLWAKVGEAVCAAQHLLRSRDSVGILLLWSSWLLLWQDRASLALAEPKVPRPELLLNAAQATAAPRAVSRMGL